MRGKRVLVTGGAGFIGSHLVDRLVLEQPSALVVLDNLFLGTRDNLSLAREHFPDLVFVEGDAANEATVRKALSDHRIDVVFSLAVIPLPTSLERPVFTVDVNTRIALVACELLREGLFQTLVHFSSSEVYGTAQAVPMTEAHPLEPLTPYAASKAAGDFVALSYFHTFGLDVRILRPFNNYGPRQNSDAYAGVIPTVMKRALRGEVIQIHGDGGQTRDFLFVKDTANAAVRVAETPACKGQVLNVASGEELSVNRLVETMLAAVNKNVAVVHTAPRPGDVRRHCGAIQKARDLIAFRPEVPLAVGLEQTITWYQSRLATT